MKKHFRYSLLVVLGCGVSSASQAQILEIIQAVTTKIIMAIDLEVQRLQNNTIALQDAQKTLENTLSELKLQEIGSWVQKQKDLYASYFQELNQVKIYITTYHEVKELISKQEAMLSGYQQAMALFRQDSHFSSDELQHMEAVYQGILFDAGESLDIVTTILQSLVTSMSDEQRLRQIHAAADKTNTTYNNMQAFTHQNQLLSLSRAKDVEEANQIKQMYDLE